MDARQVNLGIWHKVTKAIVFLIMVALLLGVAVWYLPVIQQNERMRKEVQRLDAEIAREEEQARKAQISIEALKSDRATIERTARERLGYAKPGETVIRFQSESDPEQQGE